jgi:hypothetical protein
MKSKNLLFAMLIGVGLLFTTEASAQYNKVAGKNVIKERVSVTHYNEDTGVEEVRYESRVVDSDSYGNAQGNQYDLAVDGAFEGQTIAVLHFYTGEGFNFSLPKKALEEKGFSVYRWLNAAPEPKDLEEALAKSCQLWIISDQRQHLNEEHLKVIKKFFDSGKGVYIWGDNQPYYADANYVSKALIGVEMNGNLMGNKVVNLQMEEKKVGVMPNHLITTGLQHVYEGITIATLTDCDDLTPIIYGSADNLVTAVYEKEGKRLILDGGFTRLYCNWDTAGTGRYVKNAAAWLVNYERFGDKVVSNKVADDIK